MTVKCDVCNEPDQIVGKACAFCEEIVGIGLSLQGEAEDLMDTEYTCDDEDYFDVAVPGFHPVPFSEMTPTD